LTSVVGPYLEQLAELLAAQNTAAPLTPAQRRKLVTELVDLIAGHPAVVRLLAVDVTARSQIGFADDSVVARDRLATLLLGCQASERGRLVAAAALGAIVWPVVNGDLELDTAGARAALIDAAMAVMERFDSTGRTPARNAVAPRIGAGNLITTVKGRY
jgi:hypothetical protein